MTRPALPSMRRKPMAQQCRGGQQNRGNCAALFDGLPLSRRLHASWNEADLLDPLVAAQVSKPQAAVCRPVIPAPVARCCRGGQSRARHPEIAMAAVGGRPESRHCWRKLRRNRPATPETKKPRKSLGLRGFCVSGGHGTRTRNRLPGTTFPVSPLAIRLPSGGAPGRLCAQKHSNFSPRFVRCLVGSNPPLPSACCSAKSRWKSSCPGVPVLRPFATFPVHKPKPPDV